MPLLTEQEFKATMGDAMGPVPEHTPLPPDFWDYYDAIDQSDLGGFDFGPGVVARAWRNPAARFDHVLLCSDDPNAFLVIVIDLRGPVVHGHHLLDLRRLYGLDS